MHCPSCGQQQVSNDLRFCSRCGFPLSLVSAVLAHGGTLPQLNLLQESKKKKLTRRNGLVFSFLWLLFFLLIMTPFFGILTDGAPITGIMAILGIFGGLFLAVSSFFFLDSQPTFPVIQEQNYAPQPQNLAGVPIGQNALPPQQSIPINTYQPPNQNPLYAPGNWRSTTDLLNKDTSEKATQMLDPEK